MYANKELETASRDQIRSLQEQKLQALLDEVVRSNRFYQEKWRQAKVDVKRIQTLDDLRRLPFTTKSELSQNQRDYPLFGTDHTYPLERYIRFHQTSGTTGQPLRWIDTAESWDWFVSAWAYIFTGCGVGPGDRIYFAFSFGPFIGFWSAMEGARLVGALVLPGGGLDSTQRLNAIQDNGATVLLCTPTYALRLAEAAREKGFDTAGSTIRTTIHAGEPGASIPATRQRIEEAWGARCCDHAGATQVGAHSYECQENGAGLHILETEFLAEILEPHSDRPVQSGERGELVITNLGRTACPVIRYRTGDLVEPNWERCACGRTFLRFMGGIQGRADDMIILRGVNVFPSALEGVIREFREVDEYRIEVRRQKEMDELFISLEIDKDGKTCETVRREIFDEIKRKFNVRSEISVVSAGSLPRFELKARRFFRVKE